MRAVFLMAAIMLGSAAVLWFLGRSQCERSVVAVDPRGDFQVVTFLTDCGGKSLATEVGFAESSDGAETADTVFVLPGTEAVKAVVIEKAEAQIAINFPRGSRMISKRTEWNGTPIQYVEQAPLETEP